MNVNTNLAQLSDATYAGAFFVYLVALILGIIHYAKVSKVIDAKRDDAPQDTIATLEAGERKMGNMTQTMVWLGVILHIAAAIFRGFSVHRFPLGNLYEYVLTITATAMFITTVYLQRKHLRVMWPWILTPVLALMFYGGVKLYTTSAPVVPALQSIWLPIHVSTVSIGASIGLVSGVASLLYLLRVHQPKGEEKGILGAVAKPLPSTRVLDAIAYRTAIVTVPVLGLGIVLGAIWAESAWGRAWAWDPKETVSFVSWILYAGYLHARATFGRQKAWIAWINVAAFATMVFNLFFINLVVSGLHSYAGLN